MPKLIFPENFYWGAATSAHQVEGGNKNDWTEWEFKNAQRLAKSAHKKNWPDYIANPTNGEFNPLQKENYVSGWAVDHYNRFEEDFEIAKNLGHNAHRFSIEWSRIEPEQGKFNEKEIEHYRKVIEALKNRGLEPFVTLWHWTNPLWLSEIGGPKNKKFAFYFARYAQVIVKNFGDLVGFWLTINEPTSVIANSYFRGVWPPQEKSFLSVWSVYKNLAEAHNRTYETIHKINKEAKVGFANILHFNEPYNAKSFLDLIFSKIFHYFSNQKFYNLTGGKNDFLAVNYYFHNKIKFPFYIKNENKIVSDLGWEIYPEGIYHILKNLAQYKLPIYVTENGVADSQDFLRENFIKEHLRYVHKAISEGVDVRGYFYWSLLDNFEWDKGFWPRFGLVEINYKTMERKIRQSAEFYAQVAKNNYL
ncbi:MAG: glycoside hydrolase family 1 protein [Parcubacteria group bacterium]|nr:glycoside hydrolase family 1 protein [Parcubacteria group bacterium]